MLAHGVAAPAVTASQRARPQQRACCSLFAHSSSGPEPVPYSLRSFRGAAEPAARGCSVSAAAPPEARPSAVERDAPGSSSTWGSPPTATASLRDSRGTREEREAGGAAKAASYDVVALSNLCVDVFLSTEKLPSADEQERKALLKRLTASPPPTDSWEVGGNCNFMIAGSRIGLNVASLGYVGDDRFGAFLRDVLKEEEVHVLQPVSDIKEGNVDETLLCFVLVDQNSQHAFCSKYDFGPWPLLQGVTQLSQATRDLLSDTRAVFINGFTFDELPPELVVEAAQTARAAGAGVFFDPGPRCWTLIDGRRGVMDAILGVSDVVLMTEEEAEAVTGKDDAEAAGWELLRRGSAEWAVVKRGGEGAVLCVRSTGAVHHAPGFAVEVGDTVGCGDSFASAVVLGYTRGHDPNVVLALANAVGAATAMGNGAGRNVASADVVESLLHSQLADDMENRAIALEMLRAQRKHAESVRVSQRS